MKFDPEIEAMFAKATEHPAPLFDQMSVIYARRAYDEQGAVHGDRQVRCAPSCRSSRSAALVSEEIVARRHPIAIKIAEGVAKPAASPFSIAI
jgi:hypothetical protein